MKALSGALERGCGLSQAVTPSPVATAPTPPRSLTLRPLQLLNAFLLRKAWRSPGQHLPKPPMKGHPVEEANSLCRGQPRSSPAPWGMGGTLSLAVIRGVKATKWWQMAGDTSQGPESLHEASRRRGAPTQRQHRGFCSSRGSRSPLPGAGGSSSTHHVLLQMKVPAGPSTCPSATRFPAPGARGAQSGSGRPMSGAELPRRRRSGGAQRGTAWRTLFPSHWSSRCFPGA